jgi:hypothetical protein
MSPGSMESSVLMDENSSYYSVSIVVRGVTKCCKTTESFLIRKTECQFMRLSRSNVCVVEHEIYRASRLFP